MNDPQKVDFISLAGIMMAPCHNVKLLRQFPIFGQESSGLGMIQPKLLPFEI